MQPREQRQLVAMCSEVGGDLRSIAPMFQYSTGIARGLLSGATSCQQLLSSAASRHAIR